LIKESRLKRDPTTTTEEEGGKEENFGNRRLPLPTPRKERSPPATTHYSRREKGKSGKVPALGKTPLFDGGREKRGDRTSVTLDPESPEQ